MVNNNQSLILPVWVAAPSAPIANVLVAADDLAQQKAEAAAAAAEAQPVISGKEAPVPATRPTSISTAAKADEEDDGATAKAIDSTLEQIVCVNSDTLAVRNEALDKVIFRAQRN